MTDIVSIPEVTQQVIGNAHRATQGMQQVIACLSDALGIEAKEQQDGFKPRSIPQAVAGFAATAQELAEVFGSVADLFERASLPAKQEEPPVQIEAPRREQPCLPAPEEEITTPADAQNWSIVSEPEPEPTPEPVEQPEPTPEEPQMDPEVESASHEPTNRVEDYLEPSANGTGRGKRSRKGGK